MHWWLKYWITKLIILNLTIGGVQKNVIFRVVEKENPFYDVSLNFKTQRELGIIIDPSDNLILLKQGTSEFRVVAELEKLSVLNKRINKNEENNNNNNNIYNNNNNIINFITIIVIIIINVIIIIIIFFIFIDSFI